MFYIVYKKMTVFKTLKFAAGSDPRTSRRHRDRNTEGGIGRRRWPGTLQEGHRGSEGQGKRCRKSLSNAAG
ncbi:unnamed protein product [Staurois parvus]|uniref:Uncharacterized protein n=1 Tax=Staurois parvus TaxID=386267 RepID=A0ABN9FXG0_9NEOB|nr:unnamed protein product [Staurois parvus]